VRRLSNIDIDTDKNWLGYLIKNLGQPAEPKDALRQPGDDEKIYFGADSDYSLYYDSDYDEYVIYDEVNATKLMRLPKSKTLNNVLESGGVHELLHSNMNIGTDDHHAQDHETRHESGGADALPLVNLPQPDADEKITFGGPDFSIRYDSTDDVYYVRDEANGVDIMKLVKNASGAPIDLASHALRHEPNGDDAIDLPGASLSIGSGVTKTVPSGKHVQFVTAHNSTLTVDGTLQVDGSVIFMDLGG